MGQEHLTAQRTTEAEHEYALKLPHMDANTWDATTCDACGAGTPLPYSDCRTGSSVPSWHHGKGCKGVPTIRNVKTPSVDRCYAHVTGTYPRPLEHELNIPEFLTVGTPTGPVEPFEEQYEHGLVTDWRDELIHIAMAQSLQVSPGHNELHHVEHVRNDMKRFVEAQERHQRQHNTCGIQRSDTHIWLDHISKGYDTLNSADDQLIKPRWVITWNIDHNRGYQLRAGIDMNTDLKGATTRAQINSGNA